MKYYRNLFITFLVASSSLAAQPEISPTDEAVTTVELSQGYRRDSLDARSSKTEGNRSLHVRNRFKHMDIYSSRLALTVSKNDYFLRALAGYGDVRRGKYHLNAKEHGHHIEFNKWARANGDYTTDFALTLGRLVRMQDGWSIAPKIGYGFYMQKFSTKKGHAELRGIGKREGVGTHEQYKATWQSPHIGVNLQKDFNQTVSAFATYEFHFPLYYRSHGYLNAHRKGDTKYHQHNKAHKSLGHTASLGVQWNFGNGWSLKPEVELMRFYSKGGSSSHRIHLNKVDRTAYEARLTLGYSF